MSILTKELRNKPLDKPLTMIELNVVNVLHDEKAGYEPGSFTKALILAVVKADFENKSWIFKHKPELVQAVEAWQYGNLFQRWEHQFERGNDVNDDTDD